MNVEDLLSDLAELVTVESPSLNIPAVTRSAEVLAGIMERRLGTAPEIIDSPAGPHVLWRGGPSPCVLILGHHDTVFPMGTLERRPFTVDDGKVTGPGVFDMKGGIVQAIHAVASLADRSSVELLFSCDEEVGSGHSRRLIEERARACGNVLVLEASADGGALKTARKGVGMFEVIVHGRASHAGLEPEKGINSLIAAAELVTQIATFGDPSRATTVTPTVARAGTAENVVPAEARLLVDVRVAELAEQTRVEAAMASLKTSVADARIEVHGGLNRPPMSPDASTTLFPLAVDAAAEAGIHRIQGVGVGGGSDGNFTAAIGVPTLDGLGAVGGGAHADHEFVVVDTMVPRSWMLAGLIRRIVDSTPMSVDAG